MVKNLPANAREKTRDKGLIPGSERSPGEGNGNPLQYSCLKIPRTEELGGYSPRGREELDITGQLSAGAQGENPMSVSIPWTLVKAEPWGTVMGAQGKSKLGVET